MLKQVAIVAAVGIALYGATYSVAHAFEYPVIAPYFDTGPKLPPGQPDALDEGRLSHYHATTRWELKRFWGRTSGYNSYIYGAAKGYNISNNMLRAIMFVESSGIYTKTSNAGALGLMQIKYNTAEFLNYPGAAWELFKPDHNIYMGAKYLRYQADRYKGDKPDMINAYYQGSVFRWNKNDKVLPGVRRAIAQRYGHLTQLNGPYVKEMYGPYYEEYYIKRVLKWYDILNDVIVTQ